MVPSTGLAVGYLIAFFAIVAAIMGWIALRRDRSLSWVFIVLVAPWFVAPFVDPDIFPGLIAFAIAPQAWGNLVIPTWVSTFVGVGLVVAVVRRSMKNR